MMSSTSISPLVGFFQQANRVTLLLYVATVPFASTQLLPNLSLSFAAAILFFATKLVGHIFIYRRIYWAPECLSIGGLILYLIMAEYFIHQGELMNGYFITLSLNFLMLLALVDEFRRTSQMRDSSILVFSGVVTVMAALMIAGVGAQISQTGRISFIGLNENDLAFSCLIAFTCLSIWLNGTQVDKLYRQIAAYAATIVLITALISTGSRFCYALLVVEILLLITTVIIRDRRFSRGVSVATSWLIVVIAMTLISDVMVSRLNPMKDLDLGSGTIEFGETDSVIDLGGRSLKWIEAVNGMKTSLVFGLGYEGYQQYQNQSRPNFSLPHNFGFEIAAIGGLIGLAFLAILMAQLARRFFLDWRHTGSLHILNWALPLMGVAMFLNIYHMKAVWFLLAYIVASPTEKMASPHTHRVNSSATAAQTSGH